jgi:flavin-dependent dehydrogenase
LRSAARTLLRRASALRRRSQACRARCAVAPGGAHRSELDAALTEAAAAAGAEVRDSTALTTLQQQGDTVTVKTNRGDTLRARAVVGADGSASRVARYEGVRCAQVDLALEAEVPVDTRTADRWRGRLLMEWGPLPGSFGWVFPKGDVCTAGVVAARGEPAALRAYKDDFLERHGLLGPRPLHDTGHLTRCRHPGSPLARGRVLVAGDAAALVRPAHTYHASEAAHDRFR